VPPDPALACDLLFLGNRLPDREVRVERFFLKVAAAAPDLRCLLAGSGWDDKPVPANVRKLGHVSTRDHNRLNCSARAVLNVSREDMARAGYAPATRVFEAAGAGACLITDRWAGIEQFLQPNHEILVASDGPGVLALMRGLNEQRRRAIGQRARARVLREHSYASRAFEIEAALSTLHALSTRAPLLAPV
jgi:spore maturation protein CgeB